MGPSLPPQPLREGLIALGWRRAVICAAAVTACMLTGCHAEHTPPINSVTKASRVANLHAFARLYGVLRWFHPSDAASVVDWDQFAVHGVRRVMNANDDNTLSAALRELAAAIAPTVQIVRAGEHFRDEPPVPRISGDEAVFVSWEHEGYGDSTLPGTFTSKRRHREQIVPAPGVLYAILSQSIDAKQFRGTQLRLRAQVLTANHGLGRIWLRVDRGEERGFFDNMNDRPVTSATWVPAEIIGTVDKDATRIVFGTVMSLGGTVWYDDIELSAKGPNGEWRAIDIKNGGFESKDLWATWNPGTGRGTGSLEGWNVVLDHTNFASGHSALRVSAATKVVTKELFSDSPNDAETYDVSLARGLRARVPISLYSVHQHTRGDDPIVARQAAAQFSESQPDSFDVNWGLADVIIAWNALQHFWPYWDTAQIDWNAKLDAELLNALSDHNVNDHILTLRRLITGTPDSHAEVKCPGETPQAPPPLAAEVIEGQVVVVAAADAALQPGDVIVLANGHSALSDVKAEELLQSGSPQWKRVRASARFGIGPMGSSLVLDIRRGSDITFKVAVPRNRREGHPSLYKLKPIEQIEGGVYYVDLRRASLNEINSAIELLSKARGVIFDLRGYPNNNHDVLSYLLNSPVDIDEGMAIPRIIRPDHIPSSSSSWRIESTILTPRQPHISGKVAFLTDATAYSYAETVMRLVEHYHLGAIVGAATAGTNGNTAEITTATGCRVSFTGLRVTKIDGSRNHLIGIQPTIPVSKTIAGVVEGRDEVLEKALAYIHGDLR